MGVDALYYRLNRAFALRGWEGMNAALVGRPGNMIRWLDEKQFRVLALCDGRTELADGLLTESEQAFLNELMEEKIVSSCGEPDPVKPGQEYRRYGNRYIQSVQWSVTGRCNYRCRHCYMDAPDAAMGELSHEQAMWIIDQMALCGVFHVSLTGGEPFVRPDFWELVDALRKRGIILDQVYTNGWLVDDALLDQFERRGMRPEFSVSFDGVGWHDWMRGVKGAEEAALRCLRLCVARGFPVNVEMCFHKGSIHALRESVNLLAEIGVPMVKLGGVAETELWRAHAEGNEITYREYLEAAIGYIPQFYEDGCPMNVLMGGVIHMYKGSDQFRIIPEFNDGTPESKRCYLCGSIRMNCYIAPDGRLLPCISMTSCEEQIQFPNVLDIGMQKALSGSFYMDMIDSRVEDLMKVNQKCRDCEYVLKCGGGCRASALMATGDLMGSDLNLCMMWHEGWVDRIRQVAEDAIRRFPPKETKDEPTAG